MIHRLILLTIVLGATLGARALGIDECVSKAWDNYPLIRNYNIVRATNDIDLAEVDRAWLPSIGLYAQATGQNVVPAFPETLSGVLSQLGQEPKGLSKFQYRAGVDISQTVWDGGVSKARRELLRRQESVQESALDAELYTIRQRVENIFFAIVLIEQQIAQSEATCQLLSGNLARLRSMLANGVAMQSDVDIVEAELLTLKRTVSMARSTAEGYRRVLGLFIGEKIAEGVLEVPPASVPLTMTADRPEQRLFDNRISALRASERLVDTSVMPRIGLFAQAYYGYPGFDYFKSMLDRGLSFNIMAGVKVSWNIDAYYTRGLKHRSVAAEISELENARDTFDFNTALESSTQQAAIEGLREAVGDDARIIELRANVRRAAESQLENGIIDATDLLTKITDENMARITAKYHEIQLVQEIYKLKYTLNR